MIRQASRLLFASIFGAVIVASALNPVALRGQTAPPAASAPSSETANPTAEKKEQAKDENDQYRHSAMVTKLGSVMGMDAERAATTFTISNLLILVVVLGYFIAKSLPGAFRNRSTGIKKQLTDARTATQEATARLNSVEQRLSKLDEQIASMRIVAEAEAERAGERIRSAAEEEKKRILSSTALEIQSATATARREIMSYAAELAVEQASRKLVVTPDVDRALVEKFALSLPTGPGSQN